MAYYIETCIKLKLRKYVTIIDSNHIRSKVFFEHLQDFLCFRLLLYLVEDFVDLRPGFVFQFLNAAQYLGRL